MNEFRSAPLRPGAECVLWLVVTWHLKSGLRVRQLPGDKIRREARHKRQELLVSIAFVEC